MKPEPIQISLEDWVSVGLDADVWKWLIPIKLFDQHRPVRIVEVFGRDIYYNAYLVILGDTNITLGKFETRDAAEKTVAYLVMFGASYTPYHSNYKKYQS